LHLRDMTLIGPVRPTIASVGGSLLICTCPTHGAREKRANDGFFNGSLIVATGCADAAMNWS
jgi:hypothetical protein